MKQLSHAVVGRRALCRAGLLLLNLNRPATAAQQAQNRQRIDAENPAANQRHHDGADADAAAADMPPPPKPWPPLPRRSSTFSDSRLPSHFMLAPCCGWVMQAVHSGRAARPTTALYLTGRPLVEQIASRGYPSSHDCTDFGFRRANSLLLQAFSGLRAVGLLAGCASTVTTRVTNFNQWPANAAGSTFSFITRTGPGELEQATYQQYVQTELEKRGFKRAPAAQAGRLQIELTTGSRSEEKTTFAPVYQDSPSTCRPTAMWPAASTRACGPTTRSARAMWATGAINTVIQITTLQVRMLDSEGAPGRQVTCGVRVARRL